jgi:hypothetical protein
MVDADIVDRLDRCVSVGVGGEEKPFRLGENLDRFREELGACHLWHPLIREEQGYGLSALFQLGDGLETLGARTGRYDAVVLCVHRPQVAPYGSEDLRVVVHCQNHRLAHQRLPLGGISCFVLQAPFTIRSANSR